MALTQWCAKVDVLDAAYELVSDFTAGVIDDNRVNRAIDAATLRVKAQIQGRYALDVITAGLAAANLPTVVRWVACEAATTLFTRARSGEVGSDRVTDLRAECSNYVQTVCLGALYYGDDTPVPSIGGPILIVTTAPETLCGVYSCSGGMDFCSCGGCEPGGGTWSMAC